MLNLSHLLSHTYCLSQSPCFYDTLLSFLKVASLQVASKGTDVGFAKVRFDEEALLYVMECFFVHLLGNVSHCAVGQDGFSPVQANRFCV